MKAANVERIAELSWNGVGYGNFLSAVINFLVVGTVLFFVIKGIEKLKTFVRKRKWLRKLLLLPTERVLQEIKALLEKNKTDKDLA